MISDVNMTIVVMIHLLKDPIIQITMHLKSEAKFNSYRYSTQKGFSPIIYIYCEKKKFLLFFQTHAHLSTFSSYWIFFFTKPLVCSLQRHSRTQFRIKHIELTYGVDDSPPDTWNQNQFFHLTGL